MLTSKFILYSLLAVVLSFMIHEFAHWIVGELLGYEMKMTLNTAYPTSGNYKKDWHYAIISSVGPLVTLLQAIFLYVLIRRYSYKNLFPFLFACFYLEMLSGIMNIRNPNDLGRIGTYLHIGLFTLPIIFTTIHFILVHKTAKREKYSWKFILTTLLLVLVFSSVWILTNQKYNIVII